MWLLLALFGPLSPDIDIRIAHQPAIISPGTLFTVVQL